MISKKISIDILNFLIKKSNFSEIEVSNSMNLPISEINKILNPHRQSVLSQENIDSFIKKHNLKSWELFYQAIPPEHLPEKTRKKIELCKIISDRKKRRK